MASFRYPGPLGTGFMPDIDQGTLALTCTPPPGPLSAPPAVPNQCFSSPFLTAPLNIHFPTFLSFYEEGKPPFGRLGGSRDNLLQMFNSIAADPAMRNVHWIAYLLATTLHECRSANTKWRCTWSPVSETRPREGGGPYWKDVVVRDFDGSPLDSQYRRLVPRKNSKGESLLGKQHPSKISDENLGKFYDESQLQWRSYYGRGFVQITWQDNYRAMDEALQLSGSLHLNPDRALETDIAYQIMSYGMVNGSFRGSNKRHVQGKGLVGGHALGDYLGAKDDYVGARNIINGGGDHGSDIAEYARLFERWIQDSRLT